MMSYVFHSTSVARRIKAEMEVEVKRRRRGYQRLLLLALFILATAVDLASGCRISEFYCDNGECVGLDKYCDGIRDCQDGSDEVGHCSRCNRTYYGDRRKTYHMDLTEELVSVRTTYFCQMTFVAGGGELGDLVELSFDRFQLGRLVMPSTGTGTAHCMTGYMQIMDVDIRPEETGRWCGSSLGIPVYYSEKDKVNILLVLYPTEEFWGSETSSSSQAALAPEAVSLSLKFRFLSKSEAVTRYGFPQAQIYRGELIPNSVCNRLFQDCDSQMCRVHSPNFPGVTLRNVTCLYHVTQRTIPRGRHAFIIVRQPNEDKISVQDSISANAVLTSGNGIGDRSVSSTGTREIPTSGRILFRHERKLMFGDACVHDHVTIYNGYDIHTAPVLARFCGQGFLPPVISNGPDVVIAFHSAPSDQLEHHTFELNVDVSFVPLTDMGLFMSDDRRCEWVLNAEEQRSGIVRSLGHLVAPNTTCSYHFKGLEHHRVWLYFVKYRVESGSNFNSLSDQGSVKHAPIIHGALYDAGPHSLNNNTVLAKFDDESRVKLCFHARSFVHFIPLRPCKYPEESYVSNGSDLFFKYAYSPSFGLNYLHMEARYEFVDTHQDGEEMVGSSGPCDRVFYSTHRPEGTFTSPRNVFLFGRGGRKSLRCSYKFVGRSTETVRLTFHKVRLGNRKCVTVHDFHSRRYVCQPRTSIMDGMSEVMSGHQQRRNSEEEVAEIRVSQILWSSAVEIPVACVCELDRALTLDLVGNVGYVNLTVTGMTSLQDFDNFYFEASYEFYSDVCGNGVGHVLDSNNGGEISLLATKHDFSDTTTSKLRCPWLILASNDQYIQVKIPGLSSSEICDTNNRIIVFTAEESEPLNVICPSTYVTGGNVLYSRHIPDLSTNAQIGGGNGGNVNGNLIEVYSGNWNRSVNRKNRGRKRNNRNALLVEFHVIEPGNFNFRWSRGARSTERMLMGRKYRSEETSISGACDGGNEKGSVVTSFLFWTCQRKVKCNSNAEGVGREGETGKKAPGDEEVEWENCVTSSHFPWLYIGIGIGCGVLVTIVLVASLLHRRREVKAKKGKPVPTDEYPMDSTKEIDC